MAGYADRILKGAEPTVLPAEGTLRHELVINLGTARTLGVTIPSELIERAHRVIE
jgi:putative tryptophan/tyrosine transport system substrate-binding protein